MGVNNTHFCKFLLTLSNLENFMIKLKKFIAVLAISSITVACQLGSPSILFSKKNNDTPQNSANTKMDNNNSPEIGQNTGGDTKFTSATLLGTKLTKAAGTALDKEDLSYYHQTSQNTMENAAIGRVSSWSNPNNGHFGTITAIKTFQADGTYCRQYKQTINIDNKKHDDSGTACRQPDGTWKIKE